mmetsp:Transcript_1885/g.4760  ORF Transcript_1885/g.4760 Transcript_1885/m.4760 type:complete len:88 (+) Transcript_1885:40-303(+)
MFNPSMLGSMMLGGKKVPIMMVNGKPMMLVPCGGHDVYCNTLEEPEWGVLGEGEKGPAPWKPTYDVGDPFGPPASWLEPISGRNGVY